MKQSKHVVPRNHVVLALMQRKAGAGSHTKSRKAERRAENARLTSLLGA